MNVNQYYAAQNKAVIAQYLRDTKMWGEALLQLHASQQIQPGSHMSGAVKMAAEITLGDAEINFLSYGDLTAMDGDSRMAESFINLDVEL